MAIRTVSQDERLEDLLKEGGRRLVMIHFYATWCHPSRSISAVFSELCQKYSEQLVGFQVDIDRCSDLAAKCGVQCMPFFMFYKGGEKIEEFTGGIKEKLVAKVEELLSNTQFYQEVVFDEEEEMPEF